MSVLIKGMKMPESCTNCERWADCSEVAWYMGEDYDYEDLMNGELNERRHSNCPLIEVPEPHGRLIDADFEEKHYASMTINPTPDVTPQDYVHSAYTVKAFQMAKTVIEAEEETE